MPTNVCCWAIVWSSNTTESYSRKPGEWEIEAIPIIFYGPGVPQDVKPEDLSPGKHIFLNSGETEHVVIAVLDDETASLLTLLEDLATLLDKEHGNADGLYEAVDEIVTATADGVQKVPKPS